MSHTKGPWKPDLPTGKFPTTTIAIFDDLGDGVVADVYSYVNMPTTKANARLIAAAPELYDALRLAVKVLKDNNVDESMAGEFTVFSDAIAKAEGK